MIINTKRERLNRIAKQNLALETAKDDRLQRLEKELKDETMGKKSRGNSMLDEKRKMNFWFVYGCRPSAGVKSNTDMVKSILLALILNSDRINSMVLIPQALEYLQCSDAAFESASSSKI